MEFLGTFWRSFWSPLAYKNALEWKWKIFFYYVLLAVFSSLIVAVPAYKMLDDFFEKDVKSAFADFVPFQIVDGKVKTPEDKLYTYKLDSGFPLLAISETSQSDSAEYMFVIEGDKVIVGGEGQNTSVAVSEFFTSDNMTVNKAYMDKMASFFYLLAKAGIIPFLVLGALITNIFYVLILAAAAYMMTSTSPYNLGFRRCLKIAVLAITPMVLLQSFAAVFLKEDPAGFLYGLISIGIVWYVIKKLPAYLEEDSPLKREV